MIKVFKPVVIFEVELCPLQNRNTPYHHCCRIVVRLHIGFAYYLKSASQ